MKSFLTFLLCTLLGFVATAETKKSDSSFVGFEHHSILASSPLQEFVFEGVTYAALDVQAPAVDSITVPETLNGFLVVEHLPPNLRYSKENLDNKAYKKRRCSIKSRPPYIRDGTIF